MLVAPATVEPEAGGNEKRATDATNTLNRAKEKERLVSLEGNAKEGSVRSPRKRGGEACGPAVSQSREVRSTHTPPTMAPTLVDEPLPPLTGTDEVMADVSPLAPVMVTVLRGPSERRSARCDKGE